jgi:hypothetical protein
MRDAFWRDFVDMAGLLLRFGREVVGVWKAARLHCQHTDYTTTPRLFLSDCSVTWLTVSATQLVLAPRFCCTSRRSFGESMAMVVPILYVLGGPTWIRLPLTCCLGQCLRIEGSPPDFRVLLSWLCPRHGTRTTRPRVSVAFFQWFLHADSLDCILPQP